MESTASIEIYFLSRLKFLNYGFKCHAPSLRLVFKDQVSKHAERGEAQDALLNILRAYANLRMVYAAQNLFRTTLNLDF